MWQSIAQQLSEHLQHPLSNLVHTPLSGEEDDRKHRLTDGTEEWFIKIRPRPALEQFQAEFRALQRLNHLQPGLSPEPVMTGHCADEAFLVLPYLTLTDGQPDDWYHLGMALACLHRCVDQAMYGWAEDTWVGTTLQPNRWHKQWHRFFAEQRIGWQLTLLREKRLLDDHFHIKDIVELVSRQLQDHQPEPSPLHGDLWRGNVGFCNKQGILFDPASYCGDREVDLAMTELFERFPAGFYAGYEHIWPLDRGYAGRRDLYNLYHRLNHFNQFGEPFREQAVSALQRLMAG